MRKFMAGFLAFALMLLCPGFVGTACAAELPALTVSTEDAAPGTEEVVVSISLENNPGIIGMTLSIDYDHDRLEFIPGSGEFVSGFGGTGVVSSTGSGLAWGSTENITFNGPFVELKFRVLETAADGLAQVSVFYEEYNIINADNENVHFDVIDGGVEIASIQEPSEQIPMYRLYNPYSLEHLFTTNTWERDNLPNAGWILEGIAWYTPQEGPGIYRLYNPYTDGHFYTMSTAEVDSLLPLGWRMDGVVSYSAPSTGTPVYRLFNPYETRNNHHYTISTQEIDMLVNLGWILEGIAWYAM